MTHLIKPVLPVLEPADNDTCEVFEQDAFELDIHITVPHELRPIVAVTCTPRPIISPPYGYLCSLDPCKEKEKVTLQIPFSRRQRRPWKKGKWLRGYPEHHSEEL